MELELIIRYRANYIRDRNVNKFKITSIEFKLIILSKFNFNTINFIRIVLKIILNTHLPITKFNN